MKNNSVKPLPCNGSKIEKLVAELCPEGVEFKKLGEVLQRTKGTPITAKKMREINKIGAPIKILAGGKTVAYVDYGDIPEKDVLTKESVVVKSRGIIGFDYIDKPFSHKNEFWSYHSNNADIDIKYVYYYLKNREAYFQSIGQRMSKMPQLSIQDTEKFPIPIPPLEVQEAIVKILDTFTTLEAELEAELEARKQQYEYYRDELLTFGEDVEWKTLGEVSYYPKKRISYEMVSTENYVGVDNLLQNKQGKLDSNYVPTAGKLIEYIIDDILIGNIRPYLKKIWQSTNNGGTNGDVVVVRINDENKERILSRYLYFVLSSDHFFEYDMQYAKGAKMPRGNKDTILKYNIPIPPLAEQERIVAILDKFDALVNDISIGLPAEIEARSKQYEYYRDKLLTFQEKP